MSKLDLPTALQLIKAAVADAEARIGALPKDPHRDAAWWTSYRAIVADCCDQLTGTPGIRINDRWDGCKISAGGVTSSSAAGTHQALKNWIAAAAKRLAA